MFTWLSLSSPNTWVLPPKNNSNYNGSSNGVNDDNIFETFIRCCKSQLTKFSSLKIGFQLTDASLYLGLGSTAFCINMQTTHG